MDTTKIKPFLKEINPLNHSLIFAGKMDDDNKVLNAKFGDEFYAYRWDSTDLRTSDRKQLLVGYAQSQQSIHQNGWDRGISNIWYDSDIPILKSQLQKCVRRSKTRLALQTTLALMKTPSGFNELLRRLPIIMLEDVGLHQSIVPLVWLMVVYSKRPYLVNAWKEACEFILGIVESLCRTRTNSGWVGKIKYYRVLQNYSPEPTNPFSTAVWLRMKYGGTKGDMFMLQRYVAYFNMSQDEVIRGKIQPMNIGKVKELKRTEIHSWSADYHCYPGILWKASHVSGYSREDIKKAMWIFQSGTNARFDIVNKTFHDDKDEAKRYMDIWKICKPMLKQQALYQYNSMCDHTRNDTKKQERMRQTRLEVQLI